MLTVFYCLKIHSSISWDLQPTFSVCSSDYGPVSESRPRRTKGSGSQRGHRPRLADLGQERSECHQNSPAG